ncbi:MAG: hypothetical protein M1144_05010 [Candidatus Thermoplasmatota archaeon]|jgi:hypothetical protein|nr:hypothetical protein [Candidatus Thermoplasmatota archaeon]
MTTYEVEHRWQPNETNKVVEKVQGAVALIKAGKVPAGFHPHEIYAVGGKTLARCVWEAPSAKALEDLYVQLGVPTQRTITEVSEFYH